MRGWEQAVHFIAMAFGIGLVIAMAVGVFR